MRAVQYHKHHLGLESNKIMPVVNQEYMDKLTDLSDGLRCLDEF